VSMLEAEYLPARQWLRSKKATKEMHTSFLLLSKVLWSVQLCVGMHPPSASVLQISYGHL
jgi:hypothetical protein